MKPLTIEQLKALEVGDWVWYVDLRDGNSFYLKKNCMIPSSLCVFLGRNTDYSDYGAKWLAYKNKEQAEAKGEIVKIKEPRLALTDSGFMIEFEEVEKKREYFYKEQEAEHRLVELKGEKR